jgi:hypothetical protein
MTKGSFRVILEDSDGKQLYSFVVFDFPYQKGDVVIIGSEEYLVKKRIIDPLKEVVKVILTEIEN